MGYYSEADCDLEAFKTLIDRETSASDVPHAGEISKNIPLYATGTLDPSDPSLRSEWAWVLKDGPGVLVLKEAYADTSAIDEATAIFTDIIAEEKAGAGGGGDHFATAGANDRIWNALQKLCLRAPDVFVRYFGNPAIDGVCAAWLGPMYQMTAQVNLVRPGGKAQTAHRDYHLGFQTMAGAKAFPAHLHDLSAAMTLQGGIAHCDMPIESGPTKLLPFSQGYGAGYLAYRLPEFAALFEDRFVQLPLEKGDVIFFNPALFHGAGDNVSADIQRLVNLVQVSSPFGRAMEAVDRDAMCRAIYPALSQSNASPAEKHAAIAACAEGYAFPTNLDNDPPIGGLAPKSQADILTDALREGVDTRALEAELDSLSQRRLP